MATRRVVDSALLTQGFSALIQDSREVLKRYSPEQIARSKTLSKRKARLAFYKKCLRDYDIAVKNNQRKAKRKTYLLGVACVGCTYTVRVTRKWLDVAAPTCPNPDCMDFGKPMQEMESMPSAPENAPELAETLETMREEFEQEKKDEQIIGTPLDFIRPEDEEWLKGK